jgi:SnoaL-like domain
MPKKTGVLRHGFKCLFSPINQVFNFISRWLLFLVVITQIRSKGREYNDQDYCVYRDAKLTLLGPLGAFADALNPGPLSVLQAAYATLNVGNVDAAMGFFTSDVELWDARGQKRDGLEGIRRWIEGNFKANIPYVIGTAEVKGNKIHTKENFSPSYFEKLGVNPLTFGMLATIEGKGKGRASRYFLSPTMSKRRCIWVGECSC